MKPYHAPEGELKTLVYLCECVYRNRKEQAIPFIDKLTQFLINKASSKKLEPSEVVDAFCNITEGWERLFCIHGNTLIIVPIKSFEGRSLNTIIVIDECLFAEICAELLKLHKKSRLGRFFPIGLLPREELIGLFHELLATIPTGLGSCLTTTRSQIGEFFVENK